MSKTVGPYSPYFNADPFVFTSGQIGLKDGKIVEGGVEAEFKQALENLKNVLAEAGITSDQIVKTTLFLTDMNQYVQVNEIYSNFFGDHRPARSTIEVAALPLGATIEIEAIGHKA